MSEEYQKYEVDEPVIYTNGTKVELGIVKKVCGGDEYFVNYHTGDTAARTHASHLSKISNRYAYHIFRLDPDGKERKKIVGTTTVDKAFERFLLDTCPEVKKKLKAFEVIRDFVKDMMKCVDIIPPSQGGGTKVLVSSEDFEYIYECKNQEEADLFGEALQCQ